MMSAKIDSDIEIDTKITKSQQFIYKVEIKEIRSVLGKFWGNKIANFEVTLEAQVADAVQYIPNEDGGKGWLKVKLADNKSIDYKNSPWEKGLYDIEIPDYPHLVGARYEKQAPRAKTWFRIGHNGEKYLHTGGRSLGCITVTKNTRWAEIYNALIKARKGDSVSVGILEVID